MCVDIYIKNEERWEWKKEYNNWEREIKKKEDTKERENEERKKDYA